MATFFEDTVKTVLNIRYIVSKCFLTVEGEVPVTHEELFAALGLVKLPGQVDASKVYYYIKDNSTEHCRLVTKGLYQTLIKNYPNLITVIDCYAQLNDVDFSFFPIEVYEKFHGGVTD